MSTSENSNFFEFSKDLLLLENISYSSKRYSSYVSMSLGITTNLFLINSASIVFIAIPASQPLHS